MQDLEFIILNFIQENFRSHFGDTLMPLLTYLGDGGIIWVIIGFIFITIKKYRTIGIAMFISLFLSFLLGNIVLKPLIHRIRPCDVNTYINLLIPRPEDFSFPSGHTMSSFAAAMAIFLYNKKIGVFALILALVISYSRLYLYVHYPSDIIGGLIIGVSIAFFTVKIIINKIVVTK